jgi:hypothetical protein
MTIHIENIKIEQLGPLSGFELGLKSVNLIYGHNETGKTYLVEFIINSLFKTRKVCELRDVNATGRIHISGLGEDLISFSPRTRRKLDDYWSEAGRTLPTNMSRLLVIRAGESSLSQDDPSGIDHAILKEFLSNSAVIDAVQKAIPKHIQDARVVNADIIGANSGRIKERKETTAEIKRIDNLLEQLNSGYCGGELAVLSRAYKTKRETLVACQKARRGYALHLHRRVAEIDEQIARLPEEKIEALAEEIRGHSLKEKDYLRIQERRSENLEQCKDFEWLEKAVPEYEARKLAGQVKLNRLFPIAALLAIVLAFLFLIIGNNLLAAVSMLATLLFGWLYYRQLKQVLHNSAEIKEIQNLAAEYEKRFGEKLSDIATLKARWEAQKKAAERAAELERDLLEIQRDAGRIEQTIISIFGQLDQETVEKEGWEDGLQGLKQRLKELGDNRRQVELDLVRLGIAQEEYSAEEPVSEFDEGAYRRLDQECLDLQTKSNKLESGVNSLKHAIASYVDLEFSSPWEDLIDALQERRAQAVSDYRKLTAHILAGILLNKELREMAEAEDERIRTDLYSPLVLNPLREITRRYQRIDLLDGKLVVSDDFNEFNLSDLSTGAQEQVLMALRIGFAAKLLGHESLFLVLDDAFQHADWNRRGYLIEQVLELAEKGWQIIYLTMDDHIRDLFTTTFQPHFGSRFVYHELNKPVVEHLAH